jgi:serine/threonine protein kinase
MTLLGKYEVLEELGIGSMGTVYRARDTVLDREVALKTIRAGPAVEPEIKERFYREARACARLQHPRIVTVYDFGEVTDTAYISMELLVGEDLRRAIENKRNIPLGSKIELIAQVSDALAHAHRNGIIHRDIKPSNVFILGDNSAKVLDFGIARLSTSKLTNLGRVLGTPNYMAPEQILGNICDARSDLFSLAIVFFEFLTGVHPFRDAYIPRRIVGKPPETLRAVDPAFSISFEQLFERALQKQPEARFQSAEEFSVAVRTLSREQSVGLAGEERRPEVQTPVSKDTAPTAGLGSQTSIAESAERRASEFFRFMQVCDSAMEGNQVDEARKALEEMKSLAAVDARFNIAVLEYERQVMALEPDSQPPAEVVPPTPAPPTAPVQRSAPVPPAAPVPQQPVDVVNRAVSGNPVMQAEGAPASSALDVTHLFSMREVRTAVSASDSGRRSLPDADPLNNTAPFAEPMIPCDACGKQNKMGRFCIFCGAEMAAPPIQNAVSPSSAGAAEGIAAAPQTISHEPEPACPTPPADIERQTQRDRVQFRSKVILASTLAGVILAAAFTIHYLMSEVSSPLPAVGQAVVTSETADMYAGPTTAEKRLLQLRKGSKVNVVRLPQSPKPEWIEVQQIRGDKASAPGYLRLPALGQWSTFQLAGLLDPGDSAELPQRTAYLEFLRSNIAGFTSSKDKSNAWLKIAREDIAIALLQKAALPDSDAWRQYISDARDALPKTSSDPSLQQEVNTMEQKIVALLEPAPAAAAPPPPPKSDENVASIDPLLLYRHAEDAYRLGQYKKAEQFLNQIIDADPSNRKAKILRSKVRKAAAEEEALSGVGR